MKQGNRSQSILARIKLKQKTYASVCSRIAILSSYTKTYPYLIDLGLLLIEYGQLIAQIYIINYELSKDTTSDSISLHKPILLLAKLINPVYLFASEQSSFLVGLSICLMCYTFLKYCLFLYVLAIAIKNKKGKSLLLGIWIWVFKIQGRFLYFFITSLWVKTIKSLIENKSGMDNTTDNLPIIIASIAMIILEFLFSIYLQVHFTYILPTENFLSTSDFKVEMITLFQKFFTQVIQMLLLVLEVEPVLIIWIFPLLNTFISFLRDRYFFVTLPLFNLKALSWQSSLLMAATSLNLSSLLNTILDQLSGNDIRSNFIIMTWVLLTLLMIKAGNAFIKRKQIDLLKQLYNGPPKDLIQKITIVKTILEQSPLLNEFKKRYQWEFLLNCTLMANIHKECVSQTPFLFTQLNNLQTKDIKRLLLSYLERLYTKFSKNDHLRLYLSLYYLKVFKLYGLGMKIIIELQRTKSYQNSFNSLLIIDQAKNDIKRKHQTNNAPLNLLRYIKCDDFMEKLKGKMIQQAELSIELYQEINKRSPNLLKIFLHGQKIHEYKSLIEIKLKALPDILPEHYTEPLMICAHYHLTLNHSLDEYIKYKNAFIWKQQKFEKKFESEMLCEENLYQEANSLSLISGERGNEGIIVNSPQFLNELFGRVLIGSHFSSLAIPCVQKAMHDIFNIMISHANREFMNKVVFDFGYNSQGYMIPLSYYITICPYLDQGLYYFLVHRPILTRKEFIMINERGIIEGFTKKIGEKLGLLSEVQTFEKNIGLFCKELETANRAFSIISDSEKEKPESHNIEATIPTEITNSASARKDYRKGFNFSLNKNHLSYGKTTKQDENISLSLEDAQALVAVFTSEGKKLDFACLTEENLSSRVHVQRTLMYHCKMENRRYKDLSLRLITLQELILKNSSNQQKDAVLTSYEELRSPLLKRRKIKVKEIQDKSPATILIHPVDDINNVQNSYLDLQGNAKASMNILQIKRPGQIQDESSQVLAENDIVPSSQRILIKQIKSPPSPRNIQAISQQIIEEKDKVKEPGNHEDSFARKVYDEDSQTQKSRQPPAVRISKVFKDAVKTKYYPFFYKVFLALLYIVFVSIIANQVILKTMVMRDANNLEARKNFLRIAESRNDLLITHHRRTRHLWTYATGVQSDKSYPSTASSQTFIILISNDLQQLINANKGLLNATNYLDNDSRSKLFQNDVRVYETYFNQPQEIFEYLTNFQATARITETSLRGLAIARQNLSKAIPYFNIVVRNSLNDLLTRSEAAADIFQESLDNQKAETLNFIKIDLICILIVTILIIPIYGLISYIQFKNERKHLHAFVKVDPAGISNILEKVSKFKAMMQDNVGFQEIKEIDVSKYYSYSRRTESHVKILKARSSQNPDGKQTGQRFWFYNMKLFVLILVIVVLLGISFVSTMRFINSATKILTQLHFSDRIKSRLDLAVATAMELLSENGTTLIQNNYTPFEMDARLEDLQILRNTVSDIFRNENSTYDPLVEGILFGDACSYLTGTYLQFCETLRKGAQNSGLVRLMSDLEASLRDLDSKYYRIRQSSEGLKSLMVDTYLNVVIPEVALTILSSLISQNYDNGFTELLRVGQPESNMYTVLICILACLMCLFIHFGVVNKMKEAENEFKKLLDTLPANIVLTNFVLKSYLIKTSKGAFDPIKNEI